MKPIQYVYGDATQPQGEGNKIIAHVCNDIGRWGKGFVLALSKRSRKPEQEFKRWFDERESSGYALGAVQLVQIEPDIWVANMIGQHEVAVKGRANTPPVRYGAIDEALSRVAAHALDLGASVHMPRIGCGLAGGQWEKIEPLIASQLSQQDINVTVYDWD